MFLLSLVLVDSAVAGSMTASTLPETLKSVAARSGVEFGAAVGPSFLEEKPYADLLSSEFSVLEAENVMKFGPIHPRAGSEASCYDFVGADRLMEFAKAAKMKVRGHTLVWHNQNPPWLTDLSKPELAKALDNHISSVVGRYKGKVYAWDVVNEVFEDDGKLRHTVWYDRPGIAISDPRGGEYIEHAFRLARKADPGAKLFYNDYSAETLGKKSDAIYEMAKDFRARKVPLDGIGFQAHFDLAMNNAGALESVEKNFSRFAELGLDIHITELDVRIRDGSESSLAAQAELYGKFVALCLRQPRCKLIQTWGFTDKHSWIPGFHRGMGWALLWDENYKPKPSYHAVMRALRKRR